MSDFPRRCCTDRMTPAEKLHMDHFWGRAREESVESCWMLCPACDHDKTNNIPSRGAWLGGFSLFCERHGYAGQLRKTDTAMVIDEVKRMQRCRATRAKETR